MAPKKALKTSPLSITDLADKLEELSKIFTTRFDKLEGIIKEKEEENKKLLKQLEDKDLEVNRLSRQLNDLEQHGRKWCIRVMNLSIPDAESSDPFMVMRHVYDKVLEPLLVGAVEKGILRSPPPLEQVLETAHLLPAKPGTTPSIICRFFSRNIRALMFRLKKDFATKAPVQPSSTRSQSSSTNSSRAGKFLYPFYEDLTRHNFRKMRAIAQHERVESCWSVNGILRFKLKNDSAIRRVKDIYDPVDKIIN